MKQYIRPISIALGIGGIKAYPMDLNIVYQSEDFIVLNKVAGVLTHPTKFNNPDTLLNGLMHHLGMKGNVHDNMPGPITRLDRNTAGLVLFALSKDAKRTLGKMMEEKKIDKSYQALVHGKVPESGSIKLSLKKHDTKNSMVVDDDGKKAHTEYKRIQYFPESDVSLVSINLITGRMHQIRVHFKSIGHPLVGDPLYGDTKKNLFWEKEYGLNYQFLVCTELRFDYPNKEKQKFSASLPEELQLVLETL